MPDNEPTADDTLFEELKNALAAADPVPEDVLAVAKDSFTWRTIDEELAELAFDSAVAGVGVRGPATERQLTFRTEALQIEIVVHPGDERHHLDGQLTPAQTATVELRAAGVAHRLEVDDSGAFEFADIPPGPLSLRVELADGTAITTEWTPI